MRSTRSTFLPKLGELRRSRGLTQRQLADLAGASPGTIQLLETGCRGAYPKTVRKIARAFEIEPERLMEEVKMN